MIFNPSKEEGFSSSKKKKKNRDKLKYLYLFHYDRLWACLQKNRNEIVICLCCDNFIPHNFKTR